ncbi:MAG TPA: VOC family protein [Candidatus Dormibacteraeota bacterium]
MRITGVHHAQVAIPAGSEAAARRFYGDLLGMPEIDKPASLGDRGGAWFSCGDQQIHCGVENDIAPTRRHPALLTDDLEELRKRLLGSGVQVIEDRQIPGFRRFYAQDPFGNRIEFMEPTDNPR